MLFSQGANKGWPRCYVRNPKARNYCCSLWLALLGVEKMGKLKKIETLTENYIYIIMMNEDVEKVVCKSSAKNIALDF